MITAAKDASFRIIALVTKIASSTCSNNIQKLRDAIHLIPDPTSESYRSVNCDAFYARQFALPKYSEFSSRYDPMAGFWESRASKIKTHVQNLAVTSEEYPLTSTERPLTDSTVKLLRAFTFNEESMRILNLLMRDQDQYLVSSELDVEQLSMAKKLLSVATRLLRGVVEKDLALQMNVLSTIVDIACSMRSVLQLDYDFRRASLKL